MSSIPTYHQNDISSIAIFHPDNIKQYKYIIQIDCIQLTAYDFYESATDRQTDGPSL